MVKSRHTHLILRGTNLTLLRPKIDGVIWEKDDEFMQEEVEDQGNGQQIPAERGRRYAVIPSDQHLTPPPLPGTLFPYTTLFRSAKAKECCLDRFTKVDGQKGEVPSTLTKNPVRVKTLCLTATIQPNSCMVVADS